MYNKWKKLSKVCSKVSLSSQTEDKKVSCLYNWIYKKREPSLNEIGISAITLRTKRSFQNIPKTAAVQSNKDP